VRFRNKLAFVFAIAMAACFLSYGSASADSFNQNRIIDDSIFDNANSMNAGQIDNFLNSFPNSCISTNSGFLARKPIGYNPSGGYQYGGYGTAGEVIAMSAQAYGINPQVILATLQKEQSLVIGGPNYCNNGDQHKYAAAVGYGCPDSGTTYNYSGLDLYRRNGVTITNVGPTCVNSAAKAGFSQQVIRAAWLLKFGQQRSKGNVGWAVIKDSWDNSDDPQSCYGGPMTQGNRQRCPSGSNVYYDGYTTIDGTAVHMDSGATAALYWYTPHFHGNQNFFTLFTTWFGPATTSGFSWEPYSQTIWLDSSKTVVLNPDQLVAREHYYITIQVKNTGTQTWQKNIVNLATSGPNNRGSAFWQPGWPASNRPATIDQTSVEPGELASFGFWIDASRPGDFKEYFNLVADNYAWMPDWGLHFPFKVQPRTYTWQHMGQNAYTDASKTTPFDLTQAAPGQRYYLTVQLKNLGNVVWRKNGINLGTSGPNNRMSAIYDPSWASPNRPATLDQVKAGYGDTASFSFWARAPLSGGGSMREYFDPVEEGLGWFPDYGMNWQIQTPQASYSWQHQGQGVYTDASATTPVDPTNLAPNTRYFLKTQIKNTGNVLWYPGYINLATTGPQNRTSRFYDNTWLSASRPATIAGNTDAGQSTSFGFWIKTPATPGTYDEYFGPVADGITWLADYGMFWRLIVHP
jgi:hypothetical protein